MFLEDQKYKRKHDFIMILYMSEYWTIKVNRQGQTVVYYYGLCIVPVSCDHKDMACKRGEVTSVEDYV